MYTLNKFLAEERVTKTLNGSPIKRSKFGVGKLIGGNLYLHKNYIRNLSDELQAKIQEAADQLSGEKFNVVKVSMQTPDVTFINSPDFDIADEPTTGEWTKVSADNIRKGTSNMIWHHKWLWVKDDYRGFDVDRSFKRSEAWLTIPDIDFARIGNKQLWQSEYVPKINKLIGP